MIQFTIIDEPDQQFSAILSQRRVTIRLRYNFTSERWSLDLSLDDLPVITAQRIVPGMDLLANYELDIGSIFALGTDETYRGLIDGTMILYHASAEEIGIY